MNAEIVAVGTELLMGQITNTNARYISARLQEAGVNVFYHSVVGDNPARLHDVFKIALERSDAVILTGGLGPTQDDLTKNVIAEAMGRRLVLHRESLENIERFFTSIGRKMTPNNERQAYFPEDSVILGNSNGTAPGCMIEQDGKTIFLLPGPPNEMEKMFEDHVMPYFTDKSEYLIESRYIRIIGVGESAVEDRIMDLIDTQKNPTIATYAKDGEVTIRITARYARAGEHEDLLEPVIYAIKDRFGRSVYCCDDMEIEKCVAQALIKNNTTIALAESCTGGLIASRLTEYPGISSVFKYGVVAYADEAKIKMLGVSQITLMKRGAVSSETAVEMAAGIKNISGADIGLAVTGIAGPEGGSDEKPVGLVYIALADKDGVECEEFHLRGSRSRIRNIAAKNAINLIRLHLPGD